MKAKNKLKFLKSKRNAKRSQKKESKAAKHQLNVTEWKPKAQSSLRRQKQLASAKAEFKEKDALMELKKSLILWRNS